MNFRKVDAGGTAFSLWPLALWLVVLLAWRFLAARDADLNLSIDEAQYFLWSLEPAWGYFSKPPMIAWTIAAFTPICGDSESCVRLPALLLFAATAWIVALLARRLFDARTALWSGIAFATLFLTGFYSWFMTTDSVLLFFWSLSLLLLLRALEHDSWLDWLLLGLAAGCGLLTKYSMGLFLVCALAVLWVDHRPRLATPKPWVAALLAVALLAPNLLWNHAHQFATLRHTAEISQLDRQLFHPDSLLYFAAGQFGIMGPLLMPALLLAAFDRRQWRIDANHRLLFLFSVPVLGLFLSLSLLSRANANWASPVYVAATVLAVSMLVRRGHRRWLAWAIAINLLMAAGIYHWHRLAPLAGIELRRGTNPFYPLHGWDDTGRQLAELLRSTGCHAVASSERGGLVEMAYYARRALGSPVAPLAYNPDGQVRNHFDLTADIAKRPFECAVLVGNFDLSRLAQEFSSVESLPQLRIPRWGRMEPIAAWRVEGFRGYAGRSGG